MRLQDLREYRKAPLGSQFSKAAVSNLLADEQHVELLRTHIAVPNEKDLVIAKYEFDADNLMFALINRIDHDDIAGYLTVKRQGTYWQVQDTSIYDQYRSRGLGVDLYVRVVQHGYPLMCGHSLSAEAEKMWNKLRDGLRVAVLDRSTGKVLPFSDAPARDGGADSEQRYFYVAEHVGCHGAVLENYHPSSGMNNLLYENWLLNRGTPFGSFRAVRIGLEGEL